MRKIENPELDRRRLLEVLGTAGALSIAGCSGSNGSENNSAATETTTNRTSTSTSTTSAETETSTETETENLKNLGKRNDLAATPLNHVISPRYMVENGLVTGVPADTLRMEQNARTAFVDYERIRDDINIGAWEAMKANSPLHDAIERSMDDTDKLLNGEVTEKLLELNVSQEEVESDISSAGHNRVDTRYGWEIYEGEYSYRSDPVEAHVAVKDNYLIHINQKTEFHEETFPNVPEIADFEEILDANITLVDNSVDSNVESYAEADRMAEKAQEFYRNNPQDREWEYLSFRSLNKDPKSPKGGILKLREYNNDEFTLQDYEVLPDEIKEGNTVHFDIEDWYTK